VPAILKENRIQNYGPNCVLAAELRDFAGITQEAWDINGNPTIIDTPWGKGMNFDGTGDYINIPSSPNLRFIGGFTVEMLIRLTDPSSGKVILGAGYNAVNSLQINIEGGNIAILEQGGGFSYWDTGLTVNDGIWHHLVVVRNDDYTYDLYVDLVTTSAHAALQSQDTDLHDWQIGWGRPRDGAAFYFNGSIDSLRVYSQAFSLADVTTLYNNIAGLGTNP